MPCITGWQITISSILEIWKTLHAVQNYRFLLTSRLNQDCIEKCFSTICGSGGNRDNPDVMELRARFRFAAVDKLFIDNSDCTNCEADFDNVLLNISSMSSLFSARSRSNSVNISASCSSTISCEMTCEDDFDLQDMSDMPELPLEVDNVVAYMSGYLLRKCGFNDAVGRCQTCSSFYASVQLLTGSQFLFLKLKTYKQTGCLLYPTFAFCEFIRKLEQMFQNSFPKLKHTVGILKRLCLFAEKNVHMDTCGSSKCDDRLKYMVRLYMTVRIHSMIKSLNQHTASACAPKKTKRNRKAKIIVHE